MTVKTTETTIGGSGYIQAPTPETAPGILEELKRQAMAEQIALRETETRMQEAQKTAETDYTPATPGNTSAAGQSSTAAAPTDKGTAEGQVYGDLIIEIGTSALGISGVAKTVLKTVQMADSILSDRSGDPTAGAALKTAKKTLPGFISDNTKNLGDLASIPDKSQTAWGKIGATPRPLDEIFGRAANTGNFLVESGKPGTFKGTDQKIPGVQIARTLTASRQLANEQVLQQIQKVEYIQGPAIAAARQMGLGPGSMGAHMRLDLGMHKGPKPPTSLGETGGTSTV